jgi:hypothetical protein
MFSFSFFKESYIFPEFVLLFDCSEEKMGGRLLGLNYFVLSYVYMLDFIWRNLFIASNIILISLSTSGKN